VENSAAAAAIENERPRRFGRDLALGALIGLVLFGAIVGINRLRNRSADNAKLTAVETGFLRDMIDHHAQALTISKAYLANNAKGNASSYASEVILFQDQEIGVMKALLTEDREAVARPDDQAMAWMGHSMTVAEMPGMQPQAALDKLGQATGAEADTMWFNMMTDHHRGGVEMLQAVLDRSKVKRITAMADKMNRNQKSEIVEYRQAMRRFGLTPAATLPSTPAGNITTTTAHKH
jgi:uncharacterized protein (DUF305 family)